VEIHNPAEYEADSVQAAISGSPGDLSYHHCPVLKLSTNAL
jgi:hypothetical protein